MYLGRNRARLGRRGSLGQINWGLLVGALATGVTGSVLAQTSHDEFAAPFTAASQVLSAATTASANQVRVQTPQGVVNMTPAEYTAYQQQQAGTTISPAWLAIGGALALGAVVLVASR